MKMEVEELLHQRFLNDSLIKTLRHIIIITMKENLKQILKLLVQRTTTLIFFRTSCKYKQANQP